MVTQFIKPVFYRKLFIWGLILGLVSLFLSQITHTPFYIQPVVAEITNTPAEAVWGTNGRVDAITTASDGTVYIGGEFTKIFPHTGQGVPVSTLTGAALSTFPSVNDDVRVVVSDGSGGWYIGGDFTQVGSVARNRIAHINADGTLDASWNPNADNSVRSLLLSGATLYAGGSFTNIGGQSRTAIAAIDTTTGNATSWNPAPNVGAYINNPNTFALSGTTLYVAGIFFSIGGQARSSLAAIDTSSGNATSFNPTPSGGCCGTEVMTVLLDGTTLYAGGAFTSIGGQSRNHLAAFNTTDGSVTSFNPNVSASNGDPTVRALAVSGTTLYAGGHFTSIGGQSRNYIAALNTSDGTATSWNSNADNWVYSLALSGTTLYTGGQFTTIGRPIPQ